MKTIAIVGLGLMGGSLAARCRQKFPSSKIIGISRDPGAIKLALKKKWIHKGCHDLAEVVAQADLIVLCTPLGTFEKYLLFCDQHAKPGAIVTDAGSVKGKIVRWFRSRKWKRIQYMGAHPMAGSHKRGVHAAHASLYNKSFAFVIPPREGEELAFQMTRNFWKKICGKVFEVEADEHDAIVASISHLPHALAACLVLAVKDASLRFAMGGFRDTTRVAQGHPSIWVPIFLQNRKAILESVADFEKKLKIFKQAMARGREKEITKMLEMAAQKRVQISV